MIRPVILLILLTTLLLILALPGCEKEKIVESTEYVHDIEYVTTPPDTVFRVDTVFTRDSITVDNTDTVIISDTVLVSDTVIQTETEYVYDTTLVIDTVEIVINEYDTVVVVDTVQTVQCNPSAIFAFDAMEYHCNPVILQAINQEYGYSDGWIFYLTTHQSYVAQVSNNVWDLYGFIDYWTPEWDGFAGFEYYWRMTYLGGDPSSPNNWDMAEPPATTATHVPGLKRTPEDSPAQRTLR